jgi:uncharacterized protein (DUF1778 family)
MTKDNSTPKPDKANVLHCLDFTKALPVPVAFTVHPDTHAVLHNAAITANVSLPDFLVGSAWEKARELRQVR